jgi:hypothetical protein
LDGSDLTELVGHEARHTCLGVFHEFKVQNVRTDWPEPDIQGCCEFDHAGETWDRMRLAEYFVVVAGGSEGEKHWPPAWPPSLRHPRSDEASLARICRLLNLDERQYFALIGIARDLVQHPAMKAAEGALSALLEHGSVGGRVARSVVEISLDMYFKGLHEAQQPEVHELEALLEQPPQQHAQDEAPQEREALSPHHQAMLEESLANLIAAMQHYSDRAPGAKALPITPKFWREAL